jgi:hypothetical protein
MRRAHEHRIGTRPAGPLPQRARIATDHHTALATLAALDAATSALRHAILTNNNIAEAHRRITDTTTELTNQLFHTPRSPPITAHRLSHLSRKLSRLSNPHPN